MMHQILAEFENGKYIKPYLISNLVDSNTFHKMLIESKKEYSLLDQMYDDRVQQIAKQVDFDKYMHDGRDRYCDIITYFKSQVKLINGADEVKHGQYINSCYVNNIFSFDQMNEKYGNKKIIAS